MKFPHIPDGAAPGTPERVAAIEAYCALTIHDVTSRTAAGLPAIRGRVAHVQLVALGIAESNLDNLAIGENWRNGTGEDRVIRLGETTIPLHYSLGLGWLQHDSGWLLADQIVNGVEWSLEAIREDPSYSIDLLLRRPGLVVHQGPDDTYLNLTAWAAYRKSQKYIAEVDAIYGTVIG